MARVQLDYVVRANEGGSTRENVRTFVYDRGTTTEVTGYTTEDGATEVTYPLLSNAEGRFPDAFYDVGSYDVHVEGDELDDTQPWEAVSGSTIAALSGSVVLDVRSLASGPSVGATTITLNSAPAIGARLGYIVLDPYTDQAEVRNVTVVAGAVLTVSALKYAHDANDFVLFVQGHSIPASYFGADGSTSDRETSLAQGFRECAALVLWLDLEGKTHKTSLPQILGSSGRVGNGNITAMAGSAWDTNNALLMNQQGTYYSFSALASDNVFTTTVANSIPSGATASPIMFKAPAGTTLPGGITAGKVYYATRISSTTFTVSATRDADDNPGATLDITSDGGGIAYSEVGELGRLYTHDLVLGCANLARNGIAASLQQPGRSTGHLRIDDFLDAGLVISGQQHDFTGIVELIGPTTLRDCTGIVFENASFVHFTGGLNIERTRRLIHVRKTPVAGVPDAENDAKVFNEGTCTSCYIGPHHCEVTGALANKVYYDIAAPTHNLVVEAGNISPRSAEPDAKLIWIHTGSPTTSGVSFKHINTNASSSADWPFVQDDDRGITLNFNSQDVYRKLSSYEVSSAPASTIGDKAINIIALPGGGFVKWGAQIYNQPARETRPGSTQTVDFERFLDKSGNQVYGLTKNNRPVDYAAAAPADAEVATGTIQRYFDSATGLPVLYFKGKDAAGTVFSFPIGPVGPLDKSTVDAKGDVLVGSGPDAIARLAVGSDGKVVQADAASALGVKWATPQAATIPGRIRTPYYVTDRWYGPASLNNAGSSWTENTIYLIPYFIDTDQSFKSIGIGMTVASTQAGNIARLGVWRDDPASHGPLNLVLDAGTVDVNTAAPGDVEIAISGNLALTPALYWLSCVFRKTGATYAAPTVHRVSNLDVIGRYVFGAAAIASLYASFTKSSIAEPLPSTLPTPALSTISGPLVMLKAA